MQPERQYATTDTEVQARIEPHRVYGQAVAARWIEQAAWLCAGTGRSLSGACCQTENHAQTCLYRNM